MNQEKIGKFIEKLRKEKCYTQKDLGDILGVSNGAVSKWECGNNLPDISMLKPLSEALDIDVMNLLSCREPSEEERTRRHNNKVRNKCFETIKYLTWILVLILIIVLCSFPLFLKALTKKPVDNSEDEVQVYEVKGTNENYTIDGHIIFNKEESIINLNRISSQGLVRGTNEEVYTENVKIYLEIGGKTIYSIITDYKDKEKRKLSELLNDINISNDKIKTNEYNLYELKEHFSEAQLRIECLEGDQRIEEFYINLKLQEMFN